MMRLARIASLQLFVLLAGCSRNPSAVLDYAGPHAALTGQLFWSFAGINGLIWLIVMGVLLAGLARRREPALVEPLEPAPETERRLTLFVASAIALTAFILTGYVTVSYVIDKKLIGLDRDQNLDIELTAHQWWWEIRYPGPVPSDTFTTANEIHVPVGKKVHISLKSNDVIHSFWLPNLAGKQDIIPGRKQDIYIQADREGVWQGRCAEFCGMQHANMRLKLFSESDDNFRKWEDAQRASAAEPQTAEEKHGEDVFSKGPCAMCHVVRRETSTGMSTLAPDLTHLKSRSTIGAGAAPNTKGYLAGWILDPHSIKPGVHMPSILQKPEDFQALLAYLETLK